MEGKKVVWDKGEGFRGFVFRLGSLSKWVLCGWFRFVVCFGFVLGGVLERYVLEI